MKKHLYWFCRYGLAVFIVLVFRFSLLAQFRDPQQFTWTGTPLNSDTTVDGYYQSLPAGYANGTARYPLIIYLHGDESVEDGYEAIKINSIPKLIVEGRFPETFKVRGQDHSFIVIAPHFTTKSLRADELGEAINAIINKFRVNTSRIYLTGMSRGGAYTFKYAGASIANARKLAAIVPIASAEGPEGNQTSIIGAAGLAVFATHNEKDDRVPASNTEAYFDGIKAEKQQPVPAIRIFPAVAGHDAWTRTYDPGSKEFEGKNIYEWMLQYTRSEESALPVKLTAYKAYQSAASEVTLTWTTEGDAAGSYFTIERSATGSNFTKLATLPVSQSNVYTFIDKNPPAGDSYYRLSQTEPDGSITYFPVLKVSFSPTNQPALVLRPNPVTNQALLQITDAENGPVLLSVFNAGGALVQQWTVQKQILSWQQSVFFFRLPSGSYVLHAQGKTFRQSIAFIKK